MIDDDLLLTFVREAISEFYIRDYHLIENQAHERSVVGRIFHYMETLLVPDSKYKDISHLNLDIEYNRNDKNQSNAKHTKDIDSIHTYPDTILHSRGNNNHNTLVIEYKLSSNSSSDGNESDIRKLKGFTKQSGDYCYNLGLGIRLLEDSAVVDFYKNGEKVCQETWNFR
ncbi:MAG: hypothetical protein LBV19_05615 [Streptococcaceae bacterium]|jgi:hypothetical protein|nr:hypothetical protein [Streptococcaceae bacterium]